jgi:hypothetical protein
VQPSQASRHLLKILGATQWDAIENDLILIHHPSSRQARTDH